MRKELLFLIGLLLINVSLGLTYTVTNIKDKAFYGESFEYLINFTNEQGTSVNVYLNKMFLEKTFPMSTVSPSINIDIPTYQSRTATLSVPLEEDIPRGFYWMPLLISYNNLTEQIFLEGEVLSSSLDLRNFNILSPTNVTATEEFIIELVVYSNIEGFTPSIEILVSGDNGIFYNSTSTQVMTKGLNIIDRTIKLPDNTMAGVYDILVQAELAGRVLAIDSNNLTVIPYRKISSTIQTSEDLFGKQVIKEVTNSGNEIINASVNYTFGSILEPLLLSKAVILINYNGETINTINPAVYDYTINQIVTLSPGYVARLIIELNYTGLLIAPFVILISIIGWFVITRRVLVRKEILSCRREEGELTVKVGISVRNISTKSVHDVRIIEDLPVYAKKAGGFGSIHGDIDREKGTITFSPGRLDSREEVLLTYKFKTDVELEGRINLPPASVKYTVNDKVNIAKSNTPTIQLIKQ